MNKQDRINEASVEMSFICYTILSTLARNSGYKDLVAEELKALSEACELLEEIHKEDDVSFQELTTDKNCAKDSYKQIILQSHAGDGDNILGSNTTTNL